MARYWVIGGEYADTTFTKVVGGREERLGPFATYDDAKATWQHRAWATVDSATHRYRIEEEGGAGEETHYWVVGGTYTDTHFTEPAEGGESWYGPFETYEDAKAEWQSRAWASVDDALSRYRIEKRRGARPPEADWAGAAGENRA